MLFGNNDVKKLFISRISSLRSTPDIPAQTPLTSFVNYFIEFFLPSSIVSPHFLNASKIPSLIDLKAYSYPTEFLLLQFDTDSANKIKVKFFNGFTHT